MIAPKVIEYVKNSNLYLWFEWKLSKYIWRSSL